MLISTPEDLAEHVGAPSEDLIDRRVYKDTHCGAWVRVTPPLNESYGSVLVGSIVEGANDDVVAPRRLYFPFDSDLFDKAIALLEDDVSACWGHINECERSCRGESCGYLAHCGSTEIALNEPPKEEE